MSAQREIRRELIRSFRKRPRPLIDAVVAAWAAGLLLDSEADVRVTGAEAAHSRRRFD